MKAQIKIQEIFNKDLEKTKEQTETNNNCIKNTLEGANCSIRAGGTRMEKTAEWRKTLPQNREQERRTGSERPLGQLQMHRHSHHKVPEGGGERGPEAKSEERVTENFPNMEKETTT